jgi:hypothetical protein
VSPFNPFSPYSPFSPSSPYYVEPVYSPYTPFIYVFPIPGVYPVDVVIPIDPVNPEIPPGESVIEIHTEIMVYGPPEVTMTYELSSLCDGLVTYVAYVTSGKPPYRLHLDSGDGSVYQLNAGDSIDHQYRARGIYVATLTAKDSDDIPSIYRVAVTI